MIESTQAIDLIDTVYAKPTYDQFNGVCSLLATWYIDLWNCAQGSFHWGCVSLHAQIHICKIGECSQFVVYVSLAP